MQLCFPLSPKEVKACPVPWDVYASATRVGKLRAVALLEAKAQYAVAEAMRAARLSAVGSGLGSARSVSAPELALTVAEPTAESLFVEPVAASLQAAAGALDASSGVMRESAAAGRAGAIDIGPVSVPLAFVADMPSLGGVVAPDRGSADAAVLPDAHCASGGASGRAASESDAGAEYTI